jgi:hypothetical protein
MTEIREPARRNKNGARERWRPTAPFLALATLLF